MISEIQGPPDWEGPDVLLRQTSFKALAEQRQFRYADGAVRAGSLRVRFGEVEQRGVALTAAGRDRYDRLVAEVDARLAESPTGTTRVEVAREVWRDGLPGTEQELALAGLSFCTVSVLQPTPTPGPTAGLAELVRAGAVALEPIVYEDFLPRSAAGIFSSNLTDQGTRDDELAGTPYDLEILSAVIGRPILDPTALYQAQQEASLAAAARRLGLAEITHPSSTRTPTERMPS